MEKLLKALVFTISLLTIPFFSPLMAQDEVNYTAKNTYFLGTSTGLSLSSISIKDVDDNIFTFNAEFQGGRFFIDNMVLGGVLGYSYSKFGEEKSSSTNFGVFARYYLPPKIFAGVGYLWSRSDGQDGSTGLFAGELGYAWFLNSHFALEPGVGVAFSTGDTKVTLLTFNIGLGIYL